MSASHWQHETPYGRYVLVEREQLAELRAWLIIVQVLLKALAKTCPRL